MYLDNCKTLDDVKQVYKQWARKLHPDAPGGSEQAMKDLNNEYDAAVERLSRVNAAAGAADNNQTADNTAATMAAYKAVIIALIHLDGLIIELCGSWLWVSGNTRAHKDALKAAGCKWAPKKGMWFWRPSDAATHSRHNTPMDNLP